MSTPTLKLNIYFLNPKGITNYFNLFKFVTHFRYFFSAQNGFKNRKQNNNNNKNLYNLLNLTDIYL